MRYLLIIILLVSTSVVNAQARLIPGKNLVDKKWLANKQYQMTWYILADTAKIDIGKITTIINNTGDKITVISQIAMKRATGPWTDSTIAFINDLRPIYHSSYNGQRDMVLNFGKVVTGYYNDKIKKVLTNIRDTTKEGYFDSNLYPALITWLPLRAGYKQDISIYDYNPAGKNGVLRASVEEVKRGTYQSEVSGTHDVWIVTVTDDLGGADSKSIYYIGTVDRKLWKQEITAGKRKMLMQLVEN